VRRPYRPNQLNDLKAPCFLQSTTRMRPAIVLPRQSSYCLALPNSNGGSDCVGTYLRLPFRRAWWESPAFSAPSPRPRRLRGDSGAYPLLPLSIGSCSVFVVVSVTLNGAAANCSAVGMPPAGPSGMTGPTLSPTPSFKTVSSAGFVGLS